MANFKKKQAGSAVRKYPHLLCLMWFLCYSSFMVTTVLREVTLKVKLDLTQASNIEKIEQKRLVSYIYMGPERLPGNQLGDDKVQIDDAIVDDLGAIRNLMYDKLIEEPRLIVSLRVDQNSEFGLLTDVQKELQQAGTFRINYSTKREAE